MEEPRIERKLVAILAADVVGYSRHMERDEAAALEALSAHRRIIDPLIASHTGLITGTSGDSVLAEFASVVDAVECATKIQQAIALANAEVPADRRMVFRIGINVGDVMVKDGDIFGDGVNIAARLEALAEPGGICVSRSVRDHMRNRRIVVFEDLGEQSVKNIALPIRVFRVRFDTPVPGEEAVVPGETASVPAQQAGGTDAVALELAFWESVKDSSDPAELTAYLDKFPDGAFTALAATRRETLLARPAPEEPAPDPSQVAVEVAFWQSVTESNTHEMYLAYLDKYPTGEFAALAKVALGEPPE